MGACQPRGEAKVDPVTATIETKNARDQDKEARVKKLLLLGAGESGKSTLFKQMITLYGRGFTHQQLIDNTNHVYNNIIEAIKTLAFRSQEYAVLASTKGAVEFEGCSPSDDPEISRALQIVEDMPLETVIDDELAATIELLWRDPGIQQTYGFRSKFQLFDSAEYFFSKVREVGRADYVPTQEDHLRTRVRTSGIGETDFEIDGNKFRMLDVGGQRNERKKWIHCFENVTCVIFVAAISEYDQVLYEDSTVNRMEEALTLWDTTVNSQWFTKSAFVLFLNKQDLFQDKIKRVPINQYFPNFPDSKDPHDYADAVEFLHERFQNIVQGSVPLHIHVTCATDSSNIRVVFNMVKNFILEKALQESGLMM